MEGQTILIAFDVKMRYGWLPLQSQKNTITLEFHRKIVIFQVKYQRQNGLKYKPQFSFVKHLLIFDHIMQSEVIIIRSEYKSRRYPTYSMIYLS